MEYRPLIREAAKRQKWTRYRLAQELGYKNVSGIYRVEAGKSGLSAEKLQRLLKLAGKLLVMIAAGSMFFTSNHVEAADRARLDNNTHSAKSRLMRVLHRVRALLSRDLCVYSA